MNDDPVRIGMNDAELCCVLMEGCEVVACELTHRFATFAAAISNLPAAERRQVIEFLDRRGYRMANWDGSKKRFLADVLSEIILRSFREVQK